MDAKRAVILVGHGGVPTDCPPGLAAAAMRHDAAADAQLRAWPRNDLTDPYRAGLRALLASLKATLPGQDVVEAYNEFCPPTLEAALEAVVGRGARDVTVISTMYTRGGIHSETEIPQLLERQRSLYPGVVIRYAWPFDLSTVASLLAREVTRTQQEPVKA